MLAVCSMLFGLQPVLEMTDVFKQLFLSVEISTVVSSILPPLQKLIIPVFGGTGRKIPSLRPAGLHSKACLSSEFHTTCVC